MNRSALSVSISDAGALDKSSDGPREQDLVNRYGQLPLSFEKNEGQTDRRVRFLSRGSGYQVFLTNTGVALTLGKTATRSTQVESATIRWTILGANPAARVSGQEELPGKVNYFIGNEPAQWRSGIPTFSRVHYQQVYPGIDVSYYGNQRQLEYDFVIGRGVSPQKIRMSFAGMKPIHVDSSGDLILSTNSGDVKLHRPEAYQTLNGKRRPVSASYILKGHRVSFSVGAYNQNEPLVIDPVLIYSSYLGGTSSEQGLGIAVDSQGSAYLAGSTLSTDFPVVGGFQTTKSTVDDAFVVKLNSTGTAMVYSTYLGGNGSDVANAIAVDTQGSAYLTGLTGSGSFPRTGEVFQDSAGGAIDSFLTKLSPAGSSLVYSTFLGGSNNDTAFGIAVDSSGRAYVVGRTDSTRMGFFPLTRNGSPLYKSVDGVGQWASSSSGLTASSVVGLTIDPSNSNTIYAATTNGVFKTTDAGASWNVTAVGSPVVPTATNMVAVDPTNPAIIYVAGNVAGVYKSTNGGDIYALKNSGLSSATINALTIDSTTPTTVYAGTSLTIYRSLNGGDTWTEIRNGLGSGSIRINEIVIDPTNASIIYIGTSRGMFKSTNGGVLWTAINSGGLTLIPEITALAIDPTNPSILYASGRTGIDILFKTTDAGANWTGSSTGLAYQVAGQNVPLVVNTLAIDRLNPATLFAATTGGGIFKSSNSAASWSNTALANVNAPAIAVDRNNSAKVYAGVTIGNDAFAARFSATGAIDYLLNFGGVESDEARAVAVDNSGNAYVAGSTNSTDFPLLNPLQASYGGFQDAFVTKINPSGTGFIYSTYLGGTFTDQGRGIAVFNGNAYVAGGTNSQNFPLVNPIKNSLTALDTDAFVTRLNTSGTAAEYSTYLGGEASDQAFAVAVDNGGNAYVTGVTSSTMFPTLSPVQPNLNGGFGGTDCFVTKLTSAGNTLAYSTYLGGLLVDQGNAIAVDTAGNAYVIGNTASNDFPTAKPFQSTAKGNDAFVAKLGVEADVSIAKKDSRDPVLVNTPFTYTLTVNNGGPSPATGITVTDNLPAGMTFNSATPSQGSCSFANSQVTCALGSLANAAGAVIAISVTPTSTGNVTNTATVAANEPDINNANNSVSETTKVSALPSISGRVKNSSNNGVGGILMTLSGSQAATTQTDSTGFYQFAELPAGGNYTLTPSSSILSFDPQSRSFNPLNTDQVADFLTSPCTYSLSSLAQSFTSAGGSSNVAITTQNGCPWTAVSSADWITITSGSSGAGSGIVNFTVSPTTAARAAHLTVAGLNLAIFQEFNSCGAPAFSIANYGLSSSSPVFTRTADFNGDGKPDVVVNARFSGGEGSVGLNDGAGAFSFAKISPGLEPQGVTVDDLAGDAKPDLAFVGYNSNIVRILVNNGSGGFGQATVEVPFTSQGQSSLSRGLFSADINRDGKADLLVSTPGAGAVQILMGNGGGAFNQIAPVIGNPLDVPIGVADVNSDNLPDLVFGGGGDNSRPLSVRLGNGTGGFGASIISAGTNVTAYMGVGDFDSDGRSDLAVSAVAGSSNTVSVLLGDGTGRFVTKSSFAVAQGSLPSLTVTDLNRDGKLDVAFTLGGRNVTVLLGDGLGMLGNATPIDTGASNSTPGNFGLDNADFNGDQLPDIAVADYSRGASVLRNSCAGGAPAISGRVTDSRSTSGLAGATVTLGGAQSATTQTDAGGNYIFSNLSAGASYMVTPAKGSFKFDPVSTSVNNLNGIQTANFVGTPTTLQFASQDYVADENGGSIVISVQRNGDLSGITTVDYATGSGTASSRTDYTASLGTLRFNAGESLKTFSVLLTDDNLVEGWESLSLVLSNPVGGIFNNSFEGLPNTSLLEIRDNDLTAPSTNPIDDARFFVRQHYHDFLNREPDASGWDFWTNQILACGSDAGCNEVRRIDVSASFFLSIEFQQSGYLVERFYKVAFGDAAGTSNFPSNHQLAVPVVRFDEFLKDTQRILQGVIVLQPGWEQALENNKQAYAGEFVQTSRFTATNAFPTTMTPAQFVDKLNQNAGNVLSPSERTTAINLFSGAGDTSNTTARAQALRQVAEDIDLYNAEYNRAFVLAQYFGYLRRNPNDAPESTLDYTGYDFWLTKLNQFNGNYINAEMVKAFLSSIEYRQRFGP